MSTTPSHEGGHVRVKICGITRVEDALAAESCGADAVGFVFAEGSSRQVNEEQAAEISAALGPFIARVGVFVNAPLSAVLRAVERAALTAVQLHGAETSEYAARLAEHTKVIRATSFAAAPTPLALEGYPAAAVLLDALQPGSGTAFPWHEAVAWRGHPRLVLAGGLTPANVQHAVATLRPAGVDVSSGVESAPGVKSAHLMRQFVVAARNERGPSTASGRTA